jgi:hypothetical protein
MNLTEEILLKEGKMLPVEHFYTFREKERIPEKQPISSD